MLTTTLRLARVTHPPLASSDAEFVLAFLCASTIRPNNCPWRDVDVLSSGIPGETPADRRRASRTSRAAGVFVFCDHPPLYAAFDTRTREGYAVTTNPLAEVAKGYPYVDTLPLEEYLRAYGDCADCDICDECGFHGDEHSLSCVSCRE